MPDETAVSRQHRKRDWLGQLRATRTVDRRAGRRADKFFGFTTRLTPFNVNLDLVMNRLMHIAASVLFIRPGGVGGLYDA